MLKGRRTSIFVFLILIALNLFVVLKFVAHESKIAAMNSVFDEIEHIAQNTKDSDLFEEVYGGKTDIRVANLKAFFRKYGSDLYNHSAKIVEEADKQEFDYRLLPAIAMKESTLCKFIPKNSHNCWGWGIYGNTVTRFETYDEAIETVSTGLKKHYIDKGLKTPDQIMARYTGHPENKTWAAVVNSVMKNLE